MKLNPLQCAFVVSSGKFLGFVVTRRGNRDQSHSTQIYNGLSGSYLQERGATTDRSGGSSWVVHIPFHISIKVILYHFKGS